MFLLIKFSVSLILFVSYIDACGSPPQKDGIFSLEDETVDKFPVGTEVDYSCKTGYFKRSGVGKATCIVRDGKEVWDGPTLECSLVSCPSPERIDNGRIIGTLYKFGSKLTYECNPGYERSSTKIEKYCHATGNWGRGEFKCNPVKCPDVIDPKDGLATFTSTTFGSSVRFSCISPLVLKGSPLRVCTEDKTWSGTQPTCEEMTCPNPPKKLLGGSVTVNGVKVGDSVFYICDNKQDEEVVSICRDDGKWSVDPPLCEGSLPPTDPPSQKTTGTSTSALSSTNSPFVTSNPGFNNFDYCGEPPKIKDAYHDHSSSENQFSAFTKLTYKCNKGCQSDSKNEENQQAVCTKINNEMVWIGPTLKCSNCNLIYIIIGTVVGGLLLGILSVVLICWAKKRQMRSKRKAEQTKQTDEMVNLRDGANYPSA